VFKVTGSNGSLIEVGREVNLFSGGVVAGPGGPWREMQVRGLDNAMQWMGKDDARKKKRLEELCCSGMGNF
jgi:hypothetical protein